MDAHAWWAMPLVCAGLATALFLLSRVAKGFDTSAYVVMGMLLTVLACFLVIAHYVFAH